MPTEREELRAEAAEHINRKRPAWHDNGVGIVQGSHYRAGFVDGAEWGASHRPQVTDEAECHECGGMGYHALGCPNTRVRLSAALWGPPEIMYGQAVRRGVSTGANAEYPPAPDAIATRVILATRAAGMTQTGLAEAAGLSPDKFSKCLHGKRRFSSLELALIAEATNTSVESLLGIEIKVYPVDVTDEMVDAALVSWFNGRLDKDFIEGDRRAMRAALSAALSPEPNHPDGDQR